MLTRRGWRFCLLAIAAAVAGRVFAVIELVVIGVGALGLVAVSAAWVAGTRLRLRVTRSVQPTNLYAGDTAVVNLTVLNLARRTPVFTVTDAVTGTSGATLRAGPLRTAMSSTGSYRLPTARRGRLEVGPAEVTVGDPLGLVAVSVSAGDPAVLTVYPRIVPLAPIAMPRGPEPLGEVGDLRSLRRVGEDFYALRDYTVGDDPRRIHWRSTARLGRPVVREDEVPRRDRMSVLLDVRATSYAGGTGGGPGGGTDGDDFDAAVTVAAGAIAASVRRGDAVRLVTTSGAEIGFTTAGHGVSDIFEFLAVVSLNSFGSIRSALARLGTRGTGAVVVVLGCQLHEEEADLEAVATLARRATSLVAVRIGAPAGTGGPTGGPTGGLETAPAGLPFALADLDDVAHLPAVWNRVQQAAARLRGGRG
ncbi:MAG TPA: hypothetical protein DEP66_06565, partial [Acidimicrobiaceae bacterium]|nr:hypothetical protein [Acidimicrobiaceae bacterium]